mgnify:CR=1 FL=1
MIRRQPRSTQSRSSAASDVYKRQGVIFVPVPGGEGDLENPGTFGGVVEEELIKISHPEEEDGILVLLLRLQVLPHYGSVGFHRV